MHYCYHYLVRKFDQPEAMSTAVWWVFVIHVLAIVEEINGLEQVFAAHHPIDNLSSGHLKLVLSFKAVQEYVVGQKNVLLIGGIGLLILARLGIELTASILLFIHPVFTDYSQYGYLVKTYCSISSAADILLAVFITWNLHKRRTGYHRTDMTIDLIIVYIFSTGVLTRYEVRVVLPLTPADGTGSKSIICTLSLLSVILIHGGLVDIALHAVLGKRQSLRYLNSST
ncbi:hypothetical protein EST38_g10866 [Candolleomyces aberdarensis]|uniref:DUF6534 domain-containing protein n=1 Tax=Candolleomyces aberdarensis TaxID=2316362 RepID=A0A4Q2D6A3_9AGAR|nr:hypothetical protein EST38_g10866 [Candolleomyces aberdarensis]